MASHAGTTPMTSRRDAAAAVAELAVYLEQRASEAPNLVGTMGMLEVPNGSTNVVPGRCRFTLDIRATTDAVRDACVDDVLAEAEGDLRAARRHRSRSRRRCAPPPRRRRPPGRRAGSAPSPRVGLPVHRMPSGAGHDAMKLGRGHAAGDAVRARRERRHQPQPARIERPPTTWSWRSRPSSSCSTTSPPKERAPHEARTLMTDDDDARLDAWIDAHFDDEVALPAGAGARADRHAAGQQRAARRGDGDAARRLRLRRRALSGARRRSCASTAWQSITNLVVRRRYGNGPTIALNAHGDVVPPGEGWTPRSVRRRGRRRQALRPRRGGEQERLRDLHLRRARARRRSAPSSPAASSCTSPTTRNSAASSARAGCSRGPRQARPADRRRLQLPGRDRAQRLPAARGDGARQDGARGDPGDRRRRAAGRGRDPERALRAERRSTAA